MRSILGLVPDQFKGLLGTSKSASQRPAKAQAAGGGIGKRMLQRGGKLDPKFNITVPENLDAGG
jgi:hypothetical protein